MRLRIRTAVCCTAIFSAVSFFTITFAETNPLSKAQVADQIRKVENGVDDFEKYLTSRGENAKDQAGSAKSSGEAKRGKGAKLREERSREGKSQPRKRRPSECHGRSESAPQTVCGASSIQRRIIWRPKCKWNRSWTARAR